MAGASHRLHRGSFMCPLYFIEEYFLMALSGFMVPIAFPLSVTHVKYSYHLLWFQSCLWFKRVSMFPFHWISTGLKAPSSTHKPVQRRYSATSSLSAVLDGLSCICTVKRKFLQDKLNTPWLLQSAAPDEMGGPKEELATLHWVNQKLLYIAK